jgi:multimeric flavodoxin WrbA
MPKKIVVIQGSPRKNGNTRVVATFAIEAAREQKAEVVEIDAIKLKFKKPGCIGCQKCQHSEGFVCTIDDHLAQTVATLPGYDVLVIATPIYWFGFPAQIKLVIDRMFSLVKIMDANNYRTPLHGKTVALIATGGGPLENNLEVLDLQWKNSAAIFGCSYLSCLFPNIHEKAGALKKDLSAIEKAKQFGRLLASAK